MTKAEWMALSPEERENYTRELGDPKDFNALMAATLILAGNKDVAAATVATLSGLLIGSGWTPAEILSAIFRESDLAAVLIDFQKFGEAHLAAEKN